MNRTLRTLILLAAAAGLFSRSEAQLHHFAVEASGGGPVGAQSAGSVFFIQVVAQDTFNATVGGFTGTVEVTSGADLIAGGGTSPAFTAGVLGPYPVAISSAGNFTLTATRTAGTETGTSNQFNVSAGPLHHFLVENQSGGTIPSQDVYTPFFIQIVGQDTFNNTDETFSGTVEITSNGTLLSGGGTTAGFTAGILPSHSVDFGSGGSFTITATNSAGPESGVSNSFTVNNPPPQLSLLSPSMRTAGDTGFTLSVTGTGFTTASSVLFGGAPRPTTFVADTELMAEIGPDDIDTAGSFTVTVSTPAPGGGVSTGADLMVVDASVDIRVFLEGPFSGGAMSTSLLTAGVIPHAQPFTGPPWSYAGAESVGTVPPGTVDWILIELRTDTNNATTVSRRAAFLRSDGVVVDTGGSVGVRMPGAAIGDYYVVLRQMNHLPVMSSSPRPMNAPDDSCDFTASAALYFGGGAKALTGGSFGMVAGDYSGDAFIDASDFTGPDNQIFQAGYLKSDLNLDGFIDASDFTYPDNNIFSGSNVPN